MLDVSGNFGCHTSFLPRPTSSTLTGHCPCTSLLYLNLVTSPPAVPVTGGTTEKSLRRKSEICEPPFRLFRLLSVQASHTTCPSPSPRPPPSNYIKRSKTNLQSLMNGLHKALTQRLRPDQVFLCQLLCWSHCELFQPPIVCKCHTRN